MPHAPLENRATRRDQAAKNKILIFSRGKFEYKARGRRRKCRRGKRILIVRRNFEPHAVTRAEAVHFDRIMSLFGRRVSSCICICKGCARASVLARLTLNMIAHAFTNPFEIQNNEVGEVIRCRIRRKNASKFMHLRT